MADLARLEARTASLKELRQLFSAMQALAASRVQAAQVALISTRAYTRTIEESISAAASLQHAGRMARFRGEPPQRSALIVVCSEHGFVGAFNRLLLQRARYEIQPADDVIILGRRAASIAREHVIEAAWTMATATHVDGILGTARRLASRLRERDKVRAVFGKYQGGNRFEVETRQILPPAPENFSARRDHAKPLHQLPPNVLLHRLIGELVLAELMLVLTESFASENAARLQIMQAADQSISTKLEVLTQQSRQQRQEAITSELFEIVTGGEAVTRDHR